MKKTLTEIEDLLKQAAAKAATLGPRTPSMEILGARINHAQQSVDAIQIELAAKPKNSPNQ